MYMRMYDTHILACKYAYFMEIYPYVYGLEYALTVVVYAYFMIVTARIS